MKAFIIGLFKKFGVGRRLRPRPLAGPDCISRCRGQLSHNYQVKEWLKEFKDADYEELIE